MGGGAGRKQPARNFQLRFQAAGSNHQQRIGVRTADGHENRQGIMHLKLNLTRHCIDTEIRRRYNRAISDILGRRGDPDSLEAMVDLTHRCLEQLDFPALRSRYPVLAGGTDASVAIVTDGRRVQIAVNSQPIITVPLHNREAPTG
jgi:hypothetical protein